jgi:hypothetical protein
MMSGKCPACGKFVTFVHGNPIDIHIGATKYRGVSFHCPHATCSAILGCQIDSLAVKNDIVNEVKAAVEQLLLTHG